MPGNMKAQPAMGADRDFEAFAPPIRDTSGDELAPRARQVRGAAKVKTTSRSPRRDPLVGLYLVVLLEDGAIQSVQRVRARVTAELLLVDELNLFLEAEYLRLIQLSATQNWLFFEDRDHFVFWREYRYQAPCPRK